MKGYILISSEFMLEWTLIDNITYRLDKYIYIYIYIYIYLEEGMAENSSLRNTVMKGTIISREIAKFHGRRSI